MSALNLVWTDLYCWYEDRISSVYGIQACDIMGLHVCEDHGRGTELRHLADQPAIAVFGSTPPSIGLHFSLTGCPFLLAG